MKNQTKAEKRAEFEKNWRWIKIGPSMNRAARNRMRAVARHQNGDNWRHRNEMLGQKHGRQGRLERA